MIALVGSGEYLKPIEPVDRALLDRLGNPRVVCLPTAAGTEGPSMIDRWSQLGVDHFTRLGVPVAAVPVIDSESANDPAYAKAIAEANFVYLSGGKPGYLYNTLHNSLVWEAILGVIERGGILAGCSAGAMIQGAKFFGFPGWIPAFGLIPNSTIIPHFDEISSAMLKPIRALASKELTMIGIDGNTALVHKDQHYEVLGSGTVTIWEKGNKAVFSAGMIPPEAVTQLITHSTHL